MVAVNLCEQRPVHFAWQALAAGRVEQGGDFLCAARRFAKACLDTGLERFEANLTSTKSVEQ